jgi:hypothetical protein
LSLPKKYRTKYNPENKFVHLETIKLRVAGLFVLKGVIFLAALTAKLRRVQLFFLSISHENI